nr:opa3-like protein [Quercus suber]
MSLTFKLLSLAIRTAAKPIGNYIKRQAKEHDGFRRFAVAQAQRVHRIDMRMRLGILHDPVAQDRMHEREQKAAEEKKRKAEIPIVRNEEEQRKYLDELAKQNKEGTKKESEKPKIKIRPLSEAKAIDLGANFFSEAFIFAVAAGLLVWDALRSRKRESARRDDVAERLESLEEELNRLRSKYEPGLEVTQPKPKVKSETAWWNPAGWWARTEQENVSSEDESEKAVPGDVPGKKIVKAVDSEQPEREAKITTKAEKVSAKDDTNPPLSTVHSTNFRTDEQSCLLFHLLAIQHQPWSPCSAPHSVDDAPSLLSSPILHHHQVLHFEVSAAMAESSSPN